MSGSTFKMSTLVGESPDDIEGAVLTALATSAEKVHGQQWCQITDIRASVNESGGVDLWQVELKVAFKVD